MDTGVYFLAAVVVIFSLTFASLDLHRSSAMQQDAFETVRSANQNALLYLEGDYDNAVHLTSEQMLDTWLQSLMDAENLDYDTLTINMIQMESNPPFYLVSVTGETGHYAYLEGEAAMQYYSAAGIISADDEEEQEP